MTNKKFFMTKKNSPCPTKSCMSNKNFECPKNFSTSNQKFHTTTKVFPYPYHMYKNFHAHEIRLTHSNKISTLIKNGFVQSKLAHQILIIPISTKFKSKLIQQYHKLHTMQSFMNHQHCPNFIIPYNSTMQKCPKAKIATWSHKNFQPRHTMFQIPTRSKKQ